MKNLLFATNYGVINLCYEILQFSTCAAIIYGLGYKMSVNI